MRMRVGKVTNVYPSTGKVKVMYEDEGSASLPLPMLTMNQEYSMPAVGDRVVTMHMENGSSKGFVIGTYYGGGMQPRANAGYRKDFGGGAYAACNGGIYVLSADDASVKGGSRASVSAGGAAVLMDGDVSVAGATVTIGSAVLSGDDDPGKPEPEVYLRITEEEAELRAVARISMEAEKDVSMKAQNIVLEAEEITLKCSYGEIRVEELVKRLERVEDQIGLPHTV